MNGRLSITQSIFLLWKYFSEGKHWPKNRGKTKAQDDFDENNDMQKIVLKINLVLNHSSFSLLFFLPRLEGEISAIFSLLFSTEDDRWWKKGLKIILNGFLFFVFAPFMICLRLFGPFFPVVEVNLWPWI